MNTLSIHEQAQEILEELMNRGVINTDTFMAYFEYDYTSLIRDNTNGNGNLENCIIHYLSISKGTSLEEF